MTSSLRIRRARRILRRRGSEGWTDFRLREMDGVSRELVVGAMRAANPKVRVDY